jgi:hypothetical protein
MLHEELWRYTKAGAHECSPLKASTGGSYPLIEKGVLSGITGRAPEIFTQNNTYFSKYESSLIKTKNDDCHPIFIHIIHSTAPSRAFTVPLHENLHVLLH